MSIYELFFTSISLSMDAFASSICKGMTGKNSIKNGFIISFSFGLFQALMPLIGYFLGDIFSQQIIKYDHYLALILLSLIGINMIKNYQEDTKVDSKISFKELILLSIATSIDALIVGITLSFLQVNLILSITIIGLITFIVCFIGYNLGSIVGKKLNNYAKLFGGIVLIIIGIKTFIEHIL